MLYPLRFEAQYKEKIWGGKKLSSSFGKAFPADAKVGESWEVSAVNGSESVVVNGEFKGKSLPALIDGFGADLLGKKVFDKHGGKFPLLIKFIDANDALSVQVHPDDDYAMKNHNSFGKTEIWFVLEAEEGAQINCGLNISVSKDDIKKAVEEGNLQNQLNFINVKKGDVIFVPAGRVHALMKGVVIAEVQQSSDITFRLYDWDRRDAEGNSRELHIEQALDVIDFSDDGDPLIKKDFVKAADAEIAEIVRGDFFNIEELLLERSTPFSAVADIEESFEILMFINGEAVLECGARKEELKKGDTLLIPAACGEYSLCGEADFLRIWA